MNTDQFRQNVISYFKNKDISVEKVEQETDVKSIVCHIAKSDNQKVEAIQQEMEKDLNVVIALSQNYGMNVVIVEDNDLEG